LQAVAGCCRQPPCFLSILPVEEHACHTAESAQKKNTGYDKKNTCYWPTIAQPKKKPAIKTEIPASTRLAVAGNRHAAQFHTYTAA